MIHQLSRHRRPENSAGDGGRHGGGGGELWKRGRRRHKIDAKTLTTFEAWRLFAEKTSFAAFWLDRLRNVTEEQVRGILAEIPPHRLSAGPGREFTARLLAENKRRLLAGG